MYYSVVTSTLIECVILSVDNGLILQAIGFDLPFPLKCCLSACKNIGDLHNLLL